MVKEFKYQDLDYRKITDDRALFVNIIFTEIAKNHDDLPSLLKYLHEDKQIINGIYEYVRNVYELASNQIPLLMLYMGRTSKDGYSGMDFEKNEYSEVDEFLSDVCERIYFKKY